MSAVLRAAASLVLALVLVAALVVLSSVAGERLPRGAAGLLGLFDDIVTSDPPSAFEVNGDASDVAAGPVLTR